MCSSSGLVLNSLVFKCDRLLSVPAPCEHATLDRACPHGFYLCHPLDKGVFHLWVDVQNPVIKRIEERVAAWTHIPIGGWMLDSHLPLNTPVLMLPGPIFNALPAPTTSPMVEFRPLPCACTLTLTQLTLT